MNGYKHYIRLNEAGVIVHGFSDAFEHPQTGDVIVLEDGPRHFHEAWTEPLTNERGQFRFKWQNGQRVERLPEELDQEWSRRPPEPASQVDILGQQLVERELEALDLRAQNDILGQQLVDMDLRLLQGGL